MCLRDGDVTANPLTYWGNAISGPKNLKYFSNVDETSQRKTLSDRCNYSLILFKEANVKHPPSSSESNKLSLKPFQILQIVFTALQDFLI